jgi:GNAT superfamily N-acetyltransferase
MPSNDTLILRHAETDADYLACFPVMRELRPHLSDANAFIAQVRRQAAHGYRILLAAVNDSDGQTAVGLAGYRRQENLLYGQFLYIDDLVTLADQRSTGVGAALIDALRQQARNAGCAKLVLDTGLANARAQCFYFRNGLLSAGMHFNQDLR